MSPASLRRREGSPSRCSRPSIVNLKLTVRASSFWKRLISAAENVRPSFSVDSPIPASPRVPPGCWSSYFGPQSSFFESVICVGLYWNG